jgi:methionyl-tRNA formyltransferase
MAALSADRLFILGWSQLVRQPVLDAFVSGVVGSHPSPLPSGRGRAPLPWTILEGRTRNAVTLFELSLGVDSGGILAQRWYDVPERATARDLYDINAAALRDAFIDVHDAIRDDILDPVAQDETQASYRGKRIPADGLIDFAWSAGEIDRLVRAVSTPYPGAYSYVEGYRVVFWASEPSDTRNRKGQPGQILARRGEDVLVQAGAGDAIWLCEPQIADAAGEQVDPRSVLRVGQCLGYRMQDEIHALRERIARLEAILTERGDA